MELSHPVVAVVSSAGGLDDTVAVLSGLTPDVQATAIVLRHAAPEAPNVLPQILERRLGRAVTLAEDGSALEPGAILVGPTACHTLVTSQRTISLIPSGPFPPWRPSADLLLTTMALALGPMAVAVVLSGSGHDGATGATAVHRHRGLVIASDEESSHEFRMPMSTIVRDQIRPPVLPVPEIAEHLPELLATLGRGLSLDDLPLPASLRQSVDADRDRLLT